MERIVHKTKSFKEAKDWDIRQYLLMSPQERMEIARILKSRVYPPPNPDVRECKTTL